MRVGNDETTIATLDGEESWIRPAAGRRAAYLIHQRFHYEYPGRIDDLRQRLVVIPPERHGDQRLVMHKLEVSSPTTEIRREVDPFGNLVCSIAVDSVARAIDFAAWIVVEREPGRGAPFVTDETYQSAVYRESTPLTAPDPALRRIASELAGGDDAETAGRINCWVYQRLTYQHGVTQVQTTAAEALALGRGVCQDYAHLMLALCRLARLPARYVSGHLLGEGGTHAWVEVLLPDPGRPGRYHARAFDPTHGRETGLNYITVAVGRDYADVAPASGTFRAPYGGKLTAEKRASAAPLAFERAFS